jgi:hypothetical protein
VSPFCVTAVFAKVVDLIALPFPSNAKVTCGAVSPAVYP